MSKLPKDDPRYFEWEPNEGEDCTNEDYEMWAAIGMAPELILEPKAKEAYAQYLKDNPNA